MSTVSTLYNAAHRFPGGLHDNKVINLFISDIAHDIMEMKC
ncbi:hypothetical protein [Serratia plymuthica]|uniref:Uncharacterized protein n=1 Tax=Serratia plymuthica TaxID=82996 RepID=A0A2X4UIF0_SERPL|nr:hypothetical protein [Serratia plymuthica]SQI39637.1 Uncharacterised protein [Serratia plymuthica]